LLTPLVFGGASDVVGAGVYTVVFLAVGLRPPGLVLWVLWDLWSRYWDLWSLQLRGLWSHFLVWVGPGVPVL
jgi:hypothetical protein